MTGVSADLRRAWRRSARWRPATATTWIIVVTVLAYLVEIAQPNVVIQSFAYQVDYSLNVPGVPFEPWRMLTSVLLHSPIGGRYGVLGITHILFNMYALYLFGRPLESVLGAGRFVALYVLSGLGGSVGVLYAALLGVPGSTSAVLGASGAVFGVLGATLAVYRRLRLDLRYLVVLIVVNFALVLVVPNIAWQAHVGGLVVGLVVGWLLVRERGPRRRGRAIAVVAVSAVVLLLLALVPAVLMLQPAAVA